MKRMVAVVALFALAGTMAYGQVTQVVSRNAVGYVKVTVPSNTFVTASYDFEDINGADVKAGDLFGDQLPLGTIIHAFDPVSQVYISDDKSFLGWSTNITFTRGMGFWIQPPAGVSAPTNEVFEVFLMGEVPDKFTAPNTDVDIVSGFTFVSYSYPASILWTNTGVASNATLGDIAHFWDPGVGGYQSFDFSFLGWANADMVLEPGVSFIYQTASPQTWGETKPYTWP